MKKEKEAEMGVACITRFSQIKEMRGYKVFECEINYMGVKMQKALSPIIAPPSGGNS